MSLLRFVFSLELKSRIVGLRQNALAEIIASILVAGKVLPRAFLRQSRDIGVRGVLAAGFNHCPVGWQNIDKLCLLAAVTLALVLFFCVLLVAAATVFVSTAQASGQTASSRFDGDLLSSVFGSSSIFGGTEFFGGSPIHAALYAMLGFYSQLLMILAVLIVTYFVVVVVGESAQSGQPFGRMNKLWAPIRLVIALGLLVPLGLGLNAAQYITLYTAKFGSSYANEAWRIFEEKVTNKSEMLPPAVPSLRGLVGAIFLSETCAEAHSLSADPVSVFIDYGGDNFEPLDGQSAATIIERAKTAGSGTHALVWGRSKTESSWMGLSSETSLVEVCGRVSFKTVEGAVPQAYLTETIQMVAAVRPWGKKLAGIHTPHSEIDDQVALLNGLTDDLLSISNAAQQRIGTVVSTEFGKLSETTEDMSKFGWISAGVYYPAMAKTARIFMAVVRDGFPVASKVVTPEHFKRTPGDDNPPHWSYVESALRAGERIAGDVQTMSVKSSGLTADGELIDTPSFWDNLSDRPLETILNFIFSLETFRTMRDNPGLEPMAMLVKAGDSLVTRSIWTFGIGLGLDIGGSFFAELLRNIPWASRLAQLAANIGGFMVSIALIGFIAGVLLLYVLPLLPFVYFFFALLGWLIALMEALIGVPLWALAHLRIDGDDLPGQAASGGYYLLLELFLRPVIIVLATVASYLVFWGGIWVLSSTFDVAVSAIGSSFNDEAGGIDNFVFTIIFTIMAYGTAVTCFKMIDKVPNEILRWLGAGPNVRPFGGGNDDVDLKSTMLAGGAAASTLASSFQNFKQRKPRADPKDPEEPKEPKLPGKYAPGVGGGKPG